MKHIIYLLLLAIVPFVSSCSGDDYVNAIPDGSSALISIDLSKMEPVGKEKADLLKDLLHIDNVDESGIDVSAKLFLFETAEGNLGLCAKVKDKDNLKQWIGKLAQKSVAQKPIERKGFTFSVLNGSWVVGFSGHALLVMGPVVGAAQAQMQLLMAKYLKADEDQGIKNSPIYARIDSIGGGMALVAQAQALPEKMVAPFTIGAPKDADPSQVYIEAKIETHDGCLLIDGKSFAFNKQINEALQNADKVYKPIKGKYVNNMPADALMGMFVNVDGKDYIKLLQDNKGMQVLLAGINAAVDMDNILRSVNGDMSIVVPTYSDDNLQLSMAAELGNKDWLADVDYWKQSCPKGGKITDWKKDAFYYSDGKTAFYFGVTPDMQFYSGNSEERAMASVGTAKSQLPASVKQQIIGKKMVMVFNLAGLSGDKSQATAVASLLKPLFGDIKSVIYSAR